MQLTQFSSAENAFISQLAANKSHGDKPKEVQ